MNQRKRLEIRTTTSVLTAFAVVAFFFAAALAEENENAQPCVFVPARTFDVPWGWAPTNPDFGKKIGDDGEIFELTGNGDVTEWRSAPVEFESRKLYRLSFKASTAEGGAGDCVPCGTTFAHYDFNGFPKKDVPEDEYSFLFFVPDDVGNASLRLSQWETRRVYRFSEPNLTAVQPVFRLISSEKASEKADVELTSLGEGESIENGEYRFSAFSSPDATNFDRPLYSSNCGFNTSRWLLGDESNVVYRFAIETTKKTVDVVSNVDGCREKRGKIVSGRKILFASGAVSANVGYYQGGKVLVEGSFDGENWTILDETSGLGEKTIDLATFFDGKTPGEFFIRLRGVKGNDGKSCSAQIYGFSANLKTIPEEAGTFKGVGKTIYADLANFADKEKKEKDGNWSLWGVDDATGGYVVRNGELFIETNLNSPLISKDETPRKISSENESRRPFEERYVGNFARPAAFSVRVFPYFHQNYTKKIGGIEGVPGNVCLSWCEPDYRVPRDPGRVEIQDETPAHIFAAKNDYESFQIVLNAGSLPIKGISGEVLGDLATEDGAMISKKNVDLRYAYYHYVERPTDKTCAVGYYPDALVPLEQGADGKGAPLTVLPNKNQPIWITVKVPADAAAGTYRGAVRLTSEESGDVGGFNVKIPFELTVWDFALPTKNEAIETAYGVSPETIWRYHNCETEADKRAVFDLYLKAFGDYRISPYTPAPLDRIGVRWLPDENPPRCELDFSRFDAEMKRVFDTYNFTNFRLDFQGLGSGTYESRSPGSIAGFAADTPQFQAMMSDYGRKMQEHLRELDLLDAAYVYWFDEPEPKDYEFCANGFAILKKYASEINRMLTEEPSVEFEKILDAADADVDIWCPISNMYSEESAKPEREKGNRFWQYVCTGPKEPYCTEFTDHPAVELRIWNWQMFERNIVGSLIWESTYWTSGAAFPKEAQNPYLDPMSYVSGYSTTPGTKQCWGNGDGRFIYPPLTAATPGRNDGKPIFDVPNVSIRWEMLREGVQDYEMLAKLSKLAKERDLTLEQRKIIEEIFDFSPITTDMTTFSTDPRRIYEKRRAAAKAIVELSR